MNEISDKEMRDAIKTLKEINQTAESFFSAFMYCKRCKTVHLFNKETDKECADSLGLDFTSLKQ